MPRWTKSFKNEGVICSKGFKMMKELGCQGGKMLYE